MRISTLSKVTGALATVALIGVTTTSPVAAQDDESGPTLTAALTGNAETGGGDADGSGSFSAEIDASTHQLCYTLTVADIGAPTAAHIHRGAAGENGPPVVSLAAPEMGSSEACVEISADIATELDETPAAFYVNVHNEEFGAGAIRGQLEKKGSAR